MTNAIDRPAAVVPAPAHIGQATAIEQSRAAAEVAAAVHVAQQNPRNMQAALAEMRESCRQPRLADRAFFRYNRAGNQVTGPTVHLARELARCFGNVQYGIAELSRDNGKGESEMQAYAWDVERNTRAAQIFIVPHVRDTKLGPKLLTDLRDIYENNANMGARRLRAAIWAILPPWFVDEAEEICNRTLKDGGGVPLAKRIANRIKAFGDLGVSVLQLEQKLGRESGRWTEHDVAQLTVIGKSLERGETRLEDEFPPERVTAAEITGTPKSGPEDRPPATPERVVRPHGPDLHLHDDHQAARLLASMGQQIDPGKGQTKPITEFCGYATPDGPCNLPAGHETGPELDGFDGHDVVPLADGGDQR